MNEYYPQPQRNPNRLRHIATAAALTVGLAGIAAPERAEASNKLPLPVGLSAQFDNPESYATVLANPEDLPGAEMKIDREARDHLKAATLQLQYRYKSGPTKGGPNPESPWVPSCTVIKTSDGFVSTAAHCFPDMVSVGGGKYGLINGPEKAKDYTQWAGSREWAVFDPQVEPAVRQPLATVTNIVLSTRNKDAALLKVQPLPAAAPRQFLDIPEFDQMAERQSKLIPGQEVGMYGVPRSNDFKPKTGKGIYLGRMMDFGRTLDIVGISPETPHQDNCNFGASGGSFVARVKGREVISGPLNIRSNRTFDATELNGPRTADNAQVFDEFQNGIKAFWADAEFKLGVNIEQFTTLCGYAVEKPATYQDLVSGVGNFEPIPVKGGLADGEYGGMK